MSIKYRLIEKGQPGVAGGGTKKWYGTIVREEDVTTDDLVRIIEKSGSLSEPDIRGVIIALENEIQIALAHGSTVRLDRLGTLYPSIKSAGVDRESDFEASRDILGVKVNYTPGDRIRQAIRNAKFEKYKK
ncbi:MAG: HU family DNA-binding protein [Moheibacter sp.]